MSQFGENSHIKSLATIKTIQTELISKFGEKNTPLTFVVLYLVLGISFNSEYGNKEIIIEDIAKIVKESISDPNLVENNSEIDTDFLIYTIITLVVNYLYLPDEIL